jgi:hypothetical protein
MSESGAPRDHAAAEYIFSFANTRDAIDGEKKLLAAAIPAGVMPLPEEIGGAGCGICLRVTAGDLDRARTVLGKAFGSIYAVSAAGGREKKVFSPWTP